MPTITIQLFEGRTLEQKRKLVQSITEATCSSIGCEPAAVDIILNEVKRENWSTAGRLWSDKDASDEDNIREVVQSGMNFLE